MINDILKDKGVLVFGHRGYSEIAPENTLASFDLCRQLKVPGVELDVHLCRTGEVVVAHDFSMKRVTGQDLLIEETSLEDLRKLDIGIFKGEKYKGERIPLLDDLFDAFGSSFIYDIEIKSQKKTQNAELAQKTWDIICRHKLQENVCASSFNPMSLRAFNHSSRRSVPSADIFSEDPGVPKILQHGFGRHISRSSYLKPEFHQVNAGFMHKYKDNLGYPVIAWTVNDPQTAQLLMAFGVDGLIGNNPKMLLGCVNGSSKKD